MNKTTYLKASTLLSFSLALGLLPNTPALAQRSHVEVGKTLNYRQPTSPTGTDHYLYSTFFYHARKAYNMKGFAVANAEGEIASLRFNPTGICFALLSQKKQQSTVQIFDAWQTNKILHDFPEITSPTAIAYTADSRHFYIADAQNQLHAYETKQYTPTRQYALPFAPRQMTCSPNDYFLAVAGGTQVAVINQETGGVRLTLNLPRRVNQLAFSPDATLLGIATNDGTLTLYDTRTFATPRTITGLGEARSIDFHPDGKYASVLTGERDVVFINLNDANDRPHLTDEDGGLNYVRFLQDGKRQVYLTYNTPTSIKYRILKGLLPNYTNLLREELNQRMSEWSKMRSDETEEQYQARVNEETRIQQAMLFEQEIATRLADDLVGSSTVTLGSYNKETNMLSLNFDNMSPIYLTVPEDEVGTFGNTQDLEFRDVIYGLNRDDHFEMTYALVYNKQTGKTYEFNNLSRQSLDLLFADDNFVPIELVQQSSMEDVKLQAIKDEVLSTAKAHNLISDHTHIQVSTDVVPGFNAEGERINNYKVRFGYTVEGRYSVQEDFAPGKYVLAQSHAALSMLEIVTRAFEHDFSQYLQPGKRVEVRVTGSADALKITGSIPYDGCYGDFDGDPYYLDGSLNAMTVTSKSGIRTNEQLAFLRAAGVKDYIQSHLKSLQDMRTVYIYNIELAEGTGGEFRRINVEFTFVDAF